MSVREPAVAGMFYPGSAVGLRELVESCFISPGGPGALPSVNPKGPRRIVGLVCPHAGLIYSGSVAAWAYYRLAEDGLPDVAVIIGPNHRSYFPEVALTDERAWRTPLGEIHVDAGIALEIARKYDVAEIKPAAHRAEHSLEVQVPFLQYIAGLADESIKIAPILVGASARLSPVAFARELGGAIGCALEGRNAIVIASTDFTHYESNTVAQSKDSRAISNILALDEEGLLAAVEELDISMCGALSTAAAIVACKKLGALSAGELAYRNSGDITNDYSEVVGYAATEIYK